MEYSFFFSRNISSILFVFVFIYPLFFFLPTADYEAIVKLSEGFNGADMRNVCTEAGMMAIRAGRDWVIEEDFLRAVRKIADNKKLESTLHYEKL